MKKIIVTTGDVDGIGLEVALKAFLKIRPSKKIQIIFFRSALLNITDKNFSHKKISSLYKKVFSKFRFSSVGSLSEALRQPGPMIEVVSSQSPALWVEDAARACLKKEVFALVTGPLSKPSIQQAGLKDIGHTDILKRLSGAKDVHMGFIGKNFNVVLATGHIPLKNVSASIFGESLANAIRSADQLKKILKLKTPLGLLGLNPHSGDAGLIGSEESEIILPLLKKINAFETQILGPIVPDTAFVKSNLKKISVFIALYHDQGLIPFKAIHGFSGVHITLGLPMKRVSVDHGTAKDLFGKGLADATSMTDALRFAINDL